MDNVEFGVDISLFEEVKTSKNGLDGLESVFGVCSVASESFFLGGREKLVVDIVGKKEVSFLIG